MIELETLAVVWAVAHFQSYLYGHEVTMLTDHSAIKAGLKTPNPTGKHARWWTRVYGRGAKEVRIVYHLRRENVSADALSRFPQEPASLHGIAQDEAQVATVNSGTDMSELLKESPTPHGVEQQAQYGVEQRKDPDLKEMIDFFQDNVLPEDSTRAKQLSAQESQFILMDGILYYIDARHNNCKRVAVPSHLPEQLPRESHRGIYSGCFFGNRLYNMLKHWL